MVEKTISAKITFDIPANKYTTDYVLQTTNPIVLPDPAKTFSSSWFERCVVNINSFHAVHRVWGLDDATADSFFNKVVASRDCRYNQNISEVNTESSTDTCDDNTPAFLLPDSIGIQGKQNIWFIGSYIWPGIPLLEGCVASAVQVARGISYRHKLDLVLPWEGGHDLKTRKNI
jgi:hypothetical protein